MNKYLLLFAFLIISQLRTQATHIVGGEFELKHLQDFDYELTLITYFDDVNGNPAILQGETIITPYIFRKSDGALMQVVQLQRIELDNFVPYTNIDCALASIRTRRILYQAIITLPPETYNHADGYKIVWERCCRNHTITNIQNPNIAGNRFELEIPPVIKNGEPFINSSPTLFPPLSDYACINQLYFVDFAGRDLDGDSLSYELVTPQDDSQDKSFGNLVAVPVPQSNSDKEIEWISGVSSLNMIPGDPALAISKEGFLTVKPFFIGLYVFAVQVDEFRDGVKIGSLRRDFQMFVVDGCDPPVPPDAGVKLPGETEFYNEVDTIRFTVSEEKCFEFLVTDDAGEEVILRAQGVNFTQDVDQIFDFTQGFINGDNDTLRVQVCVPECPYVRDIPYIIDLIASDNACPLPQLDTVRMIIEVEPPPNEFPVLSGDLDKTVVIPERDVYTDVLTATDPDGDNLFARLEAVDFNPADFGMSLTTLNSSPGSIEVELEWDTNCQLYNYVETNHFDVYVVIDDLDFCAEFGGDTIFYNMNVILPLNTAPKISTTLASNNIQVALDDFLAFDIDVSDLDGDEISLEMSGNGFNPEDFGIEFKGGVANAKVNGRFEWNLDCQSLDITQNSSFIFYFFSEDEDECRQINSDTLELRVDVLVPFNSKPEFETYSDYELPVNETFSLDIIANDLDLDFLNLDILSGTETPPSQSFNFDKGQGRGIVSSTLKWTPECRLLGNDYSPKNYTVFFISWDDSCPHVKYDTIAINFTVKEVDADYDNFLPPNAFTPNGDGHNDVYTLEGLIENNSNLPPDNCEDQFQSINIIDRSGKQVFHSIDRSFVWTGSDQPTGVYYYHIQFLNTEYKGMITILY